MSKIAITDGQSQRLLLEFILSTEQNGPVRGRTCSCGGKTFREVHRITHPGGRTSIMYECLGCGEYSL